MAISPHQSTRRFLRLLSAAAGLGLLSQPVVETLGAQEMVTFEAADGLALHGAWYRTSGDAAAVIIAFHQGGANGMAEYGPIAPRLNEAGYDVLAVDQRSGGDRLGGVNRTVQAHGDDEEIAYCDVTPDLVGAVDYVLSAAPDRPIILWGSSYSGALVLRVSAANPPGVSGVLAFSPASGGPMVDCRGEDVSDQIRFPVLALRPLREMDLDSSVTQFARFEAQGHQTYISDPGTHGSSMLVERRVNGSTDDTWAVVLDFLRRAID